MSLDKCVHRGIKQLSSHIKFPFAPIKLVYRIAKIFPGERVTLRMEGNPRGGIGYSKHLRTEDLLIKGSYCKKF